MPLFGARSLLQESQRIGSWPYPPCESPALEPDPVGAKLSNPLHAMGQVIPGSGRSGPEHAGIGYGSKPSANG